MNNSTPTSNNAGASQWIPFGITQAAKDRATQFASRQPSRDRADRTYFNTLAVCVVRQYLSLLGIETSLEASHSWNAAIGLVNESADLWIVGRGRVECLRIENPAEEIVVPLENRQDRIAYVVVCLSENEAILMGFTEEVSEEPMEVRWRSLSSRESLQPITTFPRYLSRLDRIVFLRHWLEGIYEPGWQDPAQLLRPQQMMLIRPQPSLNPNFQGISSSSPHSPLNDSSGGSVQKAKSVVMTLAGSRQETVLLLSVTLHNDLLKVSVQLHPVVVTAEPIAGTRFTSSSPHCLAPEITLALKTQHSTLTKSVTSRAYPRDNCIQLPTFQGAWGERFSLCLSVEGDFHEKKFQL